MRRATAAAKGSSPLSRGIRAARRAPCPINRIIPALAGNTWRLTCLVTPGWDHPRSRGEYPTNPAPTCPEQGSSPLSRGIPCGDTPTRCPMGIIPALAGNTIPHAFHANGRSDHPRSRGEYSCEGAVNLLGEGSSPLSRGIRGYRFYGKLDARIIPALAGNTGSS